MKIDLKLFGKIAGKLFGKSILKGLIISVILGVGLLSPSFDFGVFDLGGNEVFAERKDEGGKEKSADVDPGPVNSTQKGLGDLLIPIIKLAVWLNWMVISFLGLLMDNLTVYSPITTPLLKNIWGIFRNLVNVSFAVLLVVLILYSAIFKDGLTGLKSTLSRFVIALIFVNFSWSIVKIVVDAGTVLTNIVYRIPVEFASKNIATKSIKEGMYTVQVFNFKIDEKDNKKKLKDKQKEFKSFKFLTCTINVKLEGVKLDGLPSAFNGDSCSIKEGLFGITKDREDEIRKGIESCKCIEKNGKDGLVEANEAMIIILRAPISQLLELKGMDGSSLASAIAINYIPLEEFHKISSGTLTWSTFTFEILFSTLFGLITLVIFVALATALFIRLIFLWFMIMASPVAFLLLVLEDFEIGYKFSDAFSRLFHVAIVVPAGVGMVFSIVFLFIGEFYHNIKMLEDSGTGTGFLHIVLPLVGLGALWMGTFKILESGPITGKIATGIMGGVQEFAKTAGENLKYVGFIPGLESQGGDFRHKMSFSDLKDNAQKMIQFGTGEKRASENLNKYRLDDKIASKIDVNIKDDDSDKIKDYMSNNIPDLDKATNKEELEKFLTKIESGDLGNGIKETFSTMNKEEKGSAIKYLLEKHNDDLGTLGTEDVNNILNVSLKAAGATLYSNIHNSIENKLESDGATTSNKSEVDNLSKEIKKLVNDDNDYKNLMEKVASKNSSTENIIKVFKKLTKEVDLKNSNKIGAIIARIGEGKLEPETS